MCPINVLYKGHTINNNYVNKLPANKQGLFPFPHKLIVVINSHLIWRFVCKYTNRLKQTKTKKIAAAAASYTNMIFAYLLVLLSENIM